jgi:hypothetical protein
LPGTHIILVPAPLVGVAPVVPAKSTAPPVQ